MKTIKIKPNKHIWKWIILDVGSIVRDYLDDKKIVHQGFFEGVENGV